MCCFLKFIFGSKGRVAALPHALPHDELHVHGGQHLVVEKNLGVDFPSCGRSPSPTMCSVGHTNDLSELRSLITHQELGNNEGN